jgi:hypothetical protein
MEAIRARIGAVVLLIAERAVIESLIDGPRIALREGSLNSRLSTEQLTE